MLVNQSTAISRPDILLVPYERHHVPTYHEWMQDPIIQSTTASEPLSIQEEYEMQTSWRTDRDKLTFIVCQPLPASEYRAKFIQSSEADSPYRMLGDVNLFLTPDDGDELAIVGEVEIMIARSQNQGNGFGKAALEAFLRYIFANEVKIVGEYSGIQYAKATASHQMPVGSPEGEGCNIKYLRVKIGEDNIRSIKLFEKAGFVRSSDGPNYFGEIEMRLEGQELANRRRSVVSDLAGDLKGGQVKYRLKDTNPT